MRVLYVDDDRVNALLFEELARVVDGVVIESASSGAEALELVAAERFDLLVLDLHMPEETGFDLLPRLREHTGATVPAMLCTADDTQALREQALAAGFMGCWSKPLELSQVLSDLRHLGGGPRA